MRSMTGFGSASKATPAGTLTGEVRSVNNRFLIVRQNLPEGLAELEPVIDRMVRNRIRRGSVTVTAKAAASPNGTSPSLDADKMRALCRQIARVKRSLGIQAPPDVEALANVPYVWTLPAPGSTWSPDAALVQEVVGAALDRAVRAREREGRATRRELRRLLGRIEAFARRLGREAPGLVEAYRAKIQDRLARIVPGAAEQEGLHKEIASMLDKCDIAEEVQRLSHHVKEFAKAIRSDAPIGRRLDFLCQEMHRETNTIASKAGQTSVIDLTIEIRADLERLKEQSENVE